MQTLNFHSFLFVSFQFMHSLVHFLAGSIQAPQISRGWLCYAYNYCSCLHIYAFALCATSCYSSFFITHMNHIDLDYGSKCNRYWITMVFALNLFSFSLSLYLYFSFSLSLSFSISISLASCCLGIFPCWFSVFFALPLINIENLSRNFFFKTKTHAR